MANLNGTNVAAAVRPFSDADTFPTAHANEILGGHHTANTLADMHTIPSDRREVGMTCTVVDTGNIYRLLTNPTSDTTDADWELISGNDAIKVMTNETDPTKISLQTKLNKMDSVAATRFMYLVYKGAKTGDVDFELTCPVKAQLLKAAIEVPTSTAITTVNNINVQYLDSSTGMWTTFIPLTIDNTDNNAKEIAATNIVEVPAGTRIRCEMANLEKDLVDFHVIIGLKTVE